MCFLTPRRPVSLIFSYFSCISTIHFIYFLFNVLVPPVLQLVDSFIFPPLLLSQSLTYLQHSCLMNNGGETVTISRILPLISDPVLLSPPIHTIFTFSNNSLHQLFFSSNLPVQLQFHNTIKPLKCYFICNNRLMLINVMAAVVVLKIPPKKGSFVTNLL